MTDAKPYPKASQLARGERRYRRKVASPKQWQAIIEAKIAGCGCRMALYCFPGSQQAHHLVSRAQGGDDVADNIVPLCPECHGLVTRRDQYALARLASRINARERAYVVGKLGEGGMERLFRVGRS